MSDFAGFLLAAVFLLCGLAAVFSLTALKLEIGPAGKVLSWARAAMLAAAGLSVVVLILLAAAFLTDDFSIAVVARFSSAELPCCYKISALWAGSAGSLLLWMVVVMVLFALWLLVSEMDDLKFNALALSIGSGICWWFSALLVFVAKPFAGCPVTVDNGVGLNPLLQNFWMVIHPPLMFIGYSAFLIPFVAVSAAVLAGRTELAGFYGQLRRWLLAGLCLMGLGIATGARWSYIELGWGGYWAWDPVENTSLLPWLVGLTALHTLIGRKVSEKFGFWVIALAPLPFILCLVATFITRSGILASVHSFDRNVMSSALLAFIGCCFLLWLVCIIRAAKGITVGPARLGRPVLDKTGLLFWASVIFVFSAAVIGVATLLPVIWPTSRSGAGFVVTRTFYDSVISGAGVISAFLVGLAALSCLRKHNRLTLEAMACSAAGLISYGLVFKLFDVTLLIALACGVCAFSFVAVFIKLWVDLKTSSRIGGNIAHLGLLLFVVAAGFSSYEQTIQTRLAKGSKMTLGSKYEFAYDSFVHKSSDGIIKVGPEIVVRKGALTKKLWPHNNLYPGGKSTAEVAVHTGLFEDIYVSFDGMTGEGRVIITAKVKPLMLWLWCAAALIVAGLALAMLEGGRASRWNLFYIV